MSTEDGHFLELIKVFSIQSIPGSLLHNNLAILMCRQ